MRFSLTCSAALTLVVAFACQSPESAKAKNQVPADSLLTSETSPVARDAQAAETPVVNFKVDGVKLPVIALAGETEILSLTDLPPLAEWKTLLVRNTEGREFRAAKPALLTGDRTMKIIKLTDQSYEFRVMELVGLKDTIRHRMPKVKVIEIQTLSYTPPLVAKTIKSLTITRKGKTRSLDMAALETIARTQEPGSEKNRDTWLLLDLLGEKSLAQGQSIVLRKSAEVELVLTSKELGDSNSAHMVKRNRRGQFHYRGWTLGEAPTRTNELRGIVEIELR